eukprot:9050628-Pyramimonas_sp.AAC.1
MWLPRQKSRQWTALGGSGRHPACSLSLSFRVAARKTAATRRRLVRGLAPEALPDSRLTREGQ